MASEAERLEFERLRAQLKAEYDRLLEARAWLNTTPEILNSFGPLKPVAFSLMQPIIKALDELVKLGSDEYEKLAPIEWDFATIAYQDRDVWLQVARAAREAQNKVEWISRDRDHDDGLVETDRSVTRGPVDPARSLPWEGQAGRAYADRILDQAAASDYIASVADAAAQFLQDAGKAFANVVLALTNLILQTYVFYTLLAIGIASLLRAVIAAPVTGGAALIWPFVAFLGAFVQRLTLLTPAVLSYETSHQVFRSEVENGTRTVQTKLGAEVPAVFRYRGTPQWPDPTREGSFPHLEQDPRTGQYRVMTDLQRRVDEATSRVDDTLDRR